MAIETTFAYVLNGDTIENDGYASVVDEIVFLDEPFVLVWVINEYQGRTWVFATDDDPVTILKKGE